MKKNLNFTSKICRLWVAFTYLASLVLAIHGVHSITNFQNGATFNRWYLLALVVIYGIASHCCCINLSATSTSLIYTRTRGIRLSPLCIEIKFNQIYSVDLKQNSLQRRMNVGDIFIHTRIPDFKELRIRNLDSPDDVISYISKSINLQECQTTI